jgi:hypothetical protein
MSERKAKAAEGKVVEEKADEAKADGANVPVGKPGRYANRLGPKPCLDEFKQQKICAIVGRGCTLQTAADYVGVARKTVYRTALMNAAFGQALREARSRGEVNLVLKVDEAAMEKGEWRAAAWLLTHCFRDKYYPRFLGVPVEQVRALFERLSEALLAEVRSPADRQRIETRLRQISADFSAAVEANRQLGQDS